MFYATDLLLILWDFVDYIERQIECLIVSRILQMVGDDTVGCRC